MPKIPCWSILAAALSITLMACTSPGTPPSPLPADEIVEVSTEGERIPSGVFAQGDGERNGGAHSHQIIAPPWLREPDPPTPTPRPEPDKIKPKDRKAGLSSLGGVRPTALPPGTEVQVRLKLLVLTTSLTEDSYAAVKQALARLGVPFDTLVTTQEDLTQARLETAPGLGNYNGIVLSTGDLSVETSPGVWQSTLSSAEWQLLASYEQDYRVRRLTMYAYPDAATTGLKYTSATSNAITVKLTTDGRAVFDDLNPNASVTVKWSYVYLAAKANTTVKPLLQTSTGGIVAAINTVGTRENLVMTTAHSPATPHTAYLTYGLVRWLTRGVFLGQRRMYLGFHVDDMFIGSDQWDANTNTVSGYYRLTADDLSFFSSFMASFRARYPLLGAVTADLLFNGTGYVKNTAAICSSSVPAGVDGLSALSNCLKGNFRWTSHTFTHVIMEEDIPQTTVQDEINKNVAVANGAGGLGLASGSGNGQFDSTALVTGGHSGLGDYWWHVPSENKGRSHAAPGLVGAAEASGIKTLASSIYASQPCLSTPEDCSFKNPSPNQGLWFPSNLPANDLLIQPRLTTALPYHVSTPTQLRSYTNYAYNNSLNYTQIIENDTIAALDQVATFTVDAYYMHQGNVRKFKGTKGNTCLLCDWLDGIGQKYTATYRVPVQNPSMTQINAVMRARQAYDAAGASAIWNKTTGLVTAQASNPGVDIPLTNTLTGTSYGVDRVVNLRDGQTVNVGTN